MSPEEIALRIIKRMPTTLPFNELDKLQADIRLAIEQARVWKGTVPGTQACDDHMRKMRDALNEKDDALRTVSDLLKEDYFENWEEALDAAEAGFKVIV